MLVPAAKVIVPPVSFEMAMPPPLPVIAFVVPLNEYVPELPAIEMPVDEPLAVTFDWKLIVALLLDATVTTVFAFAWLIVPVQPMLPLPPETLNAGAAAVPVIEPPPDPHVPLMPVRLTLPAVAVTLLNVPLTVPV